MNNNEKIFISLFLVSKLSLFAAIIPVGKGSYTDVLPAGELQTQSDIYITENIKTPVPTNDWYSSIVSDKWSFQHFAFPFSFDFEPDNQYGVIFSISYPNEIQYFSVDRNIDGYFGSHVNNGMVKLRVKKTSGDYIRPNDVRLNNFGDFHVEVLVKDNSSNEYYKTIYGHGLCFVYLEFSEGIDSIELEFSTNIQVFNKEGQNITQLVQQPYTEVSTDTIGIEIIKTPRTFYGLYFPENTKIVRISQSPPVISVKFSGSEKFMSIGLLPTKEDLSFYYNYAYSFVNNTEVSWSYNEKTNDVITNFQVYTLSKRFNQQKTLLALFPHQWKNIDSGNVISNKEYSTLRGKMKVVEGNSFSTKNKFFGILPFLPNVLNQDQVQHIIQLLNSEKDTLLEGPSDDDDNTYSTAKRCAKVADMICVADRLGDTSTRDYLITRLKNLLSNWFTYTEGEKEFFFCYNKNWGGLIGYNPAFGSENFTDQHFHYGYIIYASAILGLYDKSFVNDYGGMVELLIRNCASPYRNDPLFPFLRNMDPYEGHSWSNGFAKGVDGNDQESTSEAMNFWTSVILWSLVTGNTTYRDLGVWGYTTEYSAIKEYWFDIDKDIYPTYNRCLSSIVYGGKVTHSTYFSAEPECIHGIQFIPVHGGSFYLAYNQDYAIINYNEMISENNNQPENEVGWHSIIWRYQSLFDAPNVIQKYREDPLCLNDGDSWTSLYYWLNNMYYLGRVANSKVYSDYCVYSVFDGYDGVEKYVVYNFDSSSRTVSFYDVSNGSYIGSLVVGGYSMAVSSSLVILGDTILREILDISLVDGSTVYGEVSIEVNVVDNVGIDRVEFYIDNKLVYVDNKEPYLYIWDSSLYELGIHLIKVVVYDINGLSSYKELVVYVGKRYRLSIDVAGMGYVIVEPDKVGYDYGEIVRLIAVSSDGYKFSYWSGDVISSSNPVDIVIDRDKVVVCKFEKVEDTGEVNNKMYGYKVGSYPNPFVVKKDVVEVRFKLDDVKDVIDIEVVVYDSLGRVVKELEVEDKGEGRYMSIWDGKDKENNYVKSGIYFCKVRYKNKKDMYTKIVCVK